MSFNKIQLPAPIIAGLFKNKLVLVDTDFVSKATQADTKAGKPLFLGDNKKNILIIVNDNEAVHIREEWLSLLTNMLAACKLNMGDVAIVNRYNQNHSFDMLKTQLSPAYAILFGITTQDILLPFAIPHYQVQHYNQSVFLTAPAFQMLAGNGEAARIEKSKLWLSLKKMFNI
ncbi:MAG: hypothetical protein J0I09_01915 [Sphingobacteriia bacterium]|nr:hypothetical protein [Sphingobacteriia bacterium]